MERGYFGIGIVGGKTAANVGTLWRSALIFDASFIFTAGHRYPRQASDTVKTWKHLPMVEHSDVSAMWDAIPNDCVPIAIELSDNSVPLSEFEHPERAVYMLGAEDNGLPSSVVEGAAKTVQLPGEFCLNVAVAGSIVMYDRLTKKERN